MTLHHSHTEICYISVPTTTPFQNLIMAFQDNLNFPNMCIGMDVGGTFNKFQFVQQIYCSTIQ